MTAGTFDDPARLAERQTAILGNGPRIAPLAPADRTPEQQALIERAQPPAEIRQQRGGDDTEWVEIMAHHAALFAKHMVFAQAFMVDAALSPRHRELAVLRLAWICGAPFEWGGHVTIGKICGLSGDDIVAVITGPEAMHWSAQERAVLRATDELHFDSMIGDDTWQALSQGFDARQLIELVMLLGHYKTVAFYQNALRFRLPEGNEGLFAR